MKFYQALFILFLSYKSFQDNPGKTKSVTFLVTVNDSWKYDPPISNDTCMATIKTFPMAPDTPKNKSQIIQVGDCDHGPLTYSVNENGDTQSSIFLTFYSSVIEDASPPTCTIQWNYKFKVPMNFIGIVDTYVEASENLLPACGTADSREGYHMTYYWFYIYDWGLSSLDNFRFTGHYPTQRLDVVSVTFLVAVNVTGNGCKATAKSPPMKPGVKHEDNPQIDVSDCDGARLNFTINSKKDFSEEEHTYVDLNYFSSAYPGGDSVRCSILWDYAYRSPTERDPMRSPLPGCYTSFTFGGAYTVHFWLYIYDWEYGSSE